MKELERSHPGERVVFRRPGRIERKMRWLFARPERRPILVMGNQKSGTTAVAALLGHHCELPATIDFYPYLPPSELLTARLDQARFDRFVQRYRWEFSRPLIKEPQLAIFHEELRRHFPEARFLWVVRDPRDNIRSILNRLRLPGDAEDIPHVEKQVPPPWRLVVNGEWLGLPDGTYIERLAHRWRVIAEAALADERGTLLRYEDFLADRETTIHRLAVDLGCPGSRPIGHLVDRQFQVAGERVPFTEFFGERNLRRIEQACGEPMRRLGYRAEPALLQAEAKEDP